MKFLGKLPAAAGIAVGTVVGSATVDFFMFHNVGRSVVMSALTGALAYLYSRWRFKQMGFDPSCTCAEYQAAMKRRRGGGDE